MAFSLREIYEIITKIRRFGLVKEGFYTCSIQVQSSAGDYQSIGVRARVIVR